MGIGKPTLPDNANDRRKPLTRYSAMKSALRERLAHTTKWDTTRTNELKGGRAYYSIRIKASSGWCAVKAHGSGGARLEALWALVSEAQEFYADAVIDLSFEVEAIQAPRF